MNNKGITLAELLVAALIASLAIGATLVCYSQAFYLTELAKDTTVAVADIRDMIEEICSTPFEYITADFPDGDIDGPTDTEYDNIAGGYALGAQHIVVDYVDADVDPLEIMVTASWTDIRGRARSIQLSTFRTR